MAAAAGSGLLIGSFLNVVIARVPAGQSLVKPPSRCPRCETPILARDNIPVLSWLLLRGRARCCGEPISARYPVVEATTATAFGLVTVWVANRSADPTWPLGGRYLPSAPVTIALLAMLSLAAVSIVLAMIDIDTRRLPFWIVAPATAVAVVLLAGSGALAGSGDAALRVFIGGAALWVVYRVLHLVYPTGMGYGDVRLSAMLGAYLAWLGYGALVVGAFAGFLLGALGGVTLMLLRGAGLKATIPYGPYMLAGTWLGLVVGEPLWRAYLVTAGL